MNKNSLQINKILNPTKLPTIQYTQRVTDTYIEVGEDPIPKHIATVSMVIFDGLTAIYRWQLGMYFYNIIYILCILSPSYVY